MAGKQRAFQPAAGLCSFLDRRMRGDEAFFFFFAHLFLRDLMEPVLVAEQCVTTGQFTWQLTGGNDILNEVNRKKPRN